MSRRRWHHPVTDRLTRQLDENTADVRELEAYLARTPVRTTVSVQCDHGEILWDQVAGGRRRRVFWYGEGFKGPLMEAPASVRLACIEPCVKLLNAVGEEARRMVVTMRDHTSK